jgi:GNAT superfamily N-acetyltransferase
MSSHLHQHPHHDSHPHIRPHVRTVVVPTEAKYARPLAKIQPLIFPTLKPNELFTEAQYLHHLELFPQGQFTGLAHVHDKWVVAGSTVTFRVSWNFFAKPHNFVECISHGWLDNHDPEGEWLYGGDMSTHPDYRGLGLATKLYDARKALVRRLNLKGEVAGGMLPGYHRYRDHMSIETYVDKVSSGELTDPTLTPQLRNGFRVKRILYNYITDPRSDDCATLIVRPNPHYRHREIGV